MAGFTSCLTGRPLSSAGGSQLMAVIPVSEDPLRIGSSRHRIKRSLDRLARNRAPLRGFWSMSSNTSPEIHGIDGNER